MKQMDLLTKHVMGSTPKAVSTITLKFNTTYEDKDVESLDSMSIS